MEQFTRETPKKQKGQKTLTEKQKILYRYLIVFIVMIVVGVFSYAFFYAGKQRMDNAYQNANQSAYDGMYQVAYEFAETQNHVSNDVNISIEGVQKISRLEVLTVSGSEYVIKNADETSKIISWLEVQGTGIFTVDLTSGEFIVDSERHYVLVKIPQPRLTECKISGTGKQFWNNGWIIANGSVAEGVRLSQAQLSEGQVKLENSMKQSRRFHAAAQEAAIRMIESLVEEWNFDIQDLQVEVQFIDDF